MIEIESLIFDRSLIMLALLVNLPKDQLIQQIKDGGVLMLLGMCTVFVFLVILIYATKLMSKIISRIKPSAPETAKKSAESKTASPASVNNDALTAAAIAAAWDKSSK